MKMEDLERRTDALQQSIDALRADVNSRFRALFMLIGVYWATIIAAIIGLYLKG